MRHLFALVTSALVLVVAVSTALGHRPKPEAPPRLPLPIFAQWQGNNSNDAPRDRRVISDAASWAKTWTEIYKHDVPKPDVPEIDFEKRIVLAVFMGSKPTVGYSTRIGSIMTTDKEVIVSVQDITPAPDEDHGDLVTSPWHIVVIEKQAKPIRFQDAE